MADQHITSLYEKIDITDAELTRSRNRLTLRLEQLRPVKTADSANLEDDSTIFSWIKRPVIWAPTFTAVASLLFFMIVSRPVSLDNKSLEEIQRFVAANGNHEQLFAEAEQMKLSQSELTRLNALVLISMLGSEDTSKLASAQGLVEDPRPEFRVHYLEFLLDYADEDIYNISYIEALMDKEEDKECLYLLGRLLKLALSREQENTPFI